MVTTNKTIQTSVNVTDFINSHVDNDQTKLDSFRLIELMSKWSGFEPKMWGPVMIGFGEYHYVYASGREGDSMLIGFSPTKTGLTLYISAPDGVRSELLNALGKHRAGKVCVYIKKLSDINLDVLERLCKETIKYIGEHHECACK